MDLPLYFGGLGIAFGATRAVDALVAREAVFLPFAARALPVLAARLEREAGLAALVVNCYPISAGIGTDEADATR